MLFLILLNHALTLHQLLILCQYPLRLNPPVPNSLLSNYPTSSHRHDSIPFIALLVCHPFGSQVITIPIAFYNHRFPIFFQHSISWMYLYSSIDFVLKDKIPGIKLSFYTSFTGYGTDNFQSIAFPETRVMELPE